MVIQVKPYPLPFDKMKILHESEYSIVYEDDDRVIKVISNENFDLVDNELKVMDCIKGQYKKSCMTKLLSYTDVGKFKNFTWYTLPKYYDDLHDQLPDDWDHVVSVGCQLVVIVESLHRLKYIHRDIKPANILWENKTRENIILCDFDTTTPYVLLNNSKRRKHIEYSTNEHCCSTYFVASDRALQGCRQSRRDDMESVVWTLNFLDRNFVDDEYQDDPLLMLRRPLPKRFQLKQMLTYVQSLGYTQKPNYKLLIEMLSKK